MITCLRSRGVRPLIRRFCAAHFAACRCMHYLRWSRCAEAPRSGACPCRRPQRGPCRPAAICRDSPSRRRAPSRSEETRFSQDQPACFPQSRWWRTHIDHPGRVASAQVVQDGRLVEVRQHGHVLHHVVLGRVHLLDVTILYRQSL